MCIIIILKFRFLSLTLLIIFVIVHPRIICTHLYVCMYVDAWGFTSHCLRLETHMETPDCRSNKVLYPDRCVGSLEFEAHQRDDVLNGKLGLFGLACRCYELNCTSEMAEIKFEFLESPTNPTHVGVNETTPTCEFNEVYVCRCTQVLLAVNIA